MTKPHHLRCWTECECSCTHFTAPFLRPGESVSGFFFFVAEKSYSVHCWLLETTIVQSQEKELHVNTLQTCFIGKKFVTNSRYVTYYRTWLFWTSNCGSKIVINRWCLIASAQSIILKEQVMSMSSTDTIGMSQQYPGCRINMSYNLADPTSIVSTSLSSEHYGFLINVI